ncbi:LysM peptidoglycan-binding domain-containing protein [Mesobacillus thioparans]|uniref:C40 family peptidase n=1 Tax=Mesobacillus thioparans TaxID=370439 RepID=UPI0039EEBFAE
MKKQAVSVMTAALLSSTFAGIASADTYTVKKGDTLSHIASTYKTSVTELKKTNKLSSDLIYANQTLTVPPFAQKTTASSPVAVKLASVKKAELYTVKSGDTLSKIAASNKIKLADLMSWNGIDGHLIYPGQKLKVSGGTAVKEAVQTVPAKKEPAKPASPVQTPAKTAQSNYIIKSGDTLSKIALQYNMTVKQLKELNKLSSDLIFVGQKLKVSNQAETKDKVTTDTTAQKPVQTSEPDIISIAKEYMGVPYVWAGSTPDGFDCSGFIYYAYNKAGKQMGRYSSEGYYNRSFYVNEPQPGDLVFFENTYKKGISHMGIYLGNNEFIHAGTSGGVMISSLSETYYAKHFEGFKRFY